MVKQSSVRAILSFFDSPKRQAEEEEAKRRVSDEAKRNAAEEAAKRQAVLAEAKQMLAEEEEPRTQAGAVGGREGAAEDGGRRAEVWELLCGVQCSSHCAGGGGVGCGLWEGVMCTLCPGLRRQGTGQCHVRIRGLWVSRVPRTAQERRRWSHSRGAQQCMSLAHCAPMRRAGDRGHDPRPPAAQK